MYLMLRMLVVEGGHFVKALEDSKISAVGYDTNKQLISLGNKMLTLNNLESIAIGIFNLFRSS